MRTTRSHLAFGLSGVCARVRARTTSEGRKRTLRHATVFVDEARHGGLGGLVASSGEGHWNTGGQTEEHAPTAVAESESTRTRDSGPWSLAGEAQTAVMQLIGSRGAALERCVVRTVWVALQVAQRRAWSVGGRTNEEVRGVESSKQTTPWLQEVEASWCRTRRASANVREDNELRLALQRGDQASGESRALAERKPACFPYAQSGCNLSHAPSSFRQRTRRSQLIYWAFSRRGHCCGCDCHSKRALLLRSCEQRVPASIG